jgi:hypothetical protein
MDPAHRDIQTMISSMKVMTAIQTNLVIDVHVADVSFFEMIFIDRKMMTSKLATGWHFKMRRMCRET